MWHPSGDCFRTHTSSAVRWTRRTNTVALRHTVTVSNSGRLSLVRWLGLLAATVFLLAACGSAARPTVTADRLPDSAAAAPEPAADGAEDLVEDAQPDIDTQTPAQADDAVPGAVQFLTVEILEEFPHDATAFTQGLELHDGLFIESTGLYGQSSLRRVQPITGEVLERVRIPDQFFAEGLTRVGNELVQLTWQENTALFWDVDSLAPTREVTYEGEGWGICYDGARLVMTDGTPVLIFRDATSFDETGRVRVTLDGVDVPNLNEVECVDGDVWANIWQSDNIMRIDPATGNVTAVVDARALAPATDDANAVLNGIAWDESTQSFFVTGKLWPTMYRVNFVPAG